MTDEQETSHADARSRSNVGLASNYPYGYAPSLMELELDARQEREDLKEFWAEMYKESQAERTRKWLEEEAATGRIDLLLQEANWQVLKAEKAASLVIAKVMANRSQLSDTPAEPPCPQGEGGSSGA